MREHPIQTFHARSLPAMMLAIAMLVLAGCEEEKPPAPPAPEPEVAAVKAISMTVPRERYEIGTLSAPEHVDIKSRVQGWIAKRPMEEGADVKKDQLLYQIDEAPFKVRVDIAKSALLAAEIELKFAKEGLIVDQAKAKLARDKAALDQASLEVKRYTELVKTGAETQQRLDQYTAREKELNAVVADSTAGVAQAELEQRAQIDRGTANVASKTSELEQRTLDLSYCKITAPFDGRIGEAKYSDGALVGGPLSETLAVLRQVDPLEVNVKIDGRLLPKVLQDIEEVKVISVEISNENYIHAERGKVTFVDNAVDPETSTFLVKATIPNPKKTVLPGLYVKARLIMGIRENAIVVPEKCILQSPRGAVAYVIGQDGTLSAVPVELGDPFDDVRVISKGIKEGDTLVYEGVQFVKPGIKVKTKLQTFDLPGSLKNGKPKAETPPAAK